MDKFEKFRALKGMSFTFEDIENGLDFMLLRLYPESRDQEKINAFLKKIGMIEATVKKEPEKA